MSSFKEALEQDLARAKLDRKALAEALGISVQAVGKWVSTAAVPPGRRDEVAKLLGAKALVLTGNFPVAMAEESVPLPAVKASRAMPMPTSVNPGFARKISLAAHMEPDKARYVDQRAQIGLSHRYFDFVSPRMAAQMVLSRASGGDIFSRIIGPHYGNALLSLALLSKVSGGIEHTVYCLVVVDQDRQRPLHPLDLARLSSEAAIFGVTVQRVQSIQEAATYLTQLDDSLLDASGKTLMERDDLDDEQ